MPESFADAAPRHREDAKRLAIDSRFQNAGHLIGFAAECLVKSMLQSGGVTIDKPSGLRVHFPDLSQKIAIKGHSRLMGALLPVLNQTDFLELWRAELRYESDLAVLDAQTQWQRWVTQVDTLFYLAGIP
jgi:hypothetical protein